MAIYVVGVQKTLTWSGTIAGECYNDTLSDQVIPLDGPISAVPDLTIGMDVPWNAAITVAGQYLFETTGGSENCTPTGKKKRLGRRVVANTGIGNTVVGEANALYRVKRECSDWVPYTANINGTWSMSVDVELCFDETNTGAWPTYGGASAPDAPFESLVTYFWRARVGGSCTVSVSAGGASATATTTITTGNRFTIPFHMSLIPQVSSARMTGTCTVTATFDGEPMAPASYSRTLTYTAASVSGNSYNVTTLSEGPETSHTARMDADLAPNRSYNLSGQVRAMEDAYPGVVGLAVDRYSGAGGQSLDTNSSGAFSTSYTQKQYSINSTLDGDTDAGLAVDEWAPVRLWVRNAWLSAQGENTNDWRILLRGAAYDSFTVSQALTYLVDDGASLNPTTPKAGAWVNDANTTLSIDSGAVKAVVAGGAGSCKRTFTPDKISFAGYRYLRIRIKADTANSGFRIRVGNKSWNKDHKGAVLQAGTSYAEFDINLCCPTNTAVDKDGRDSRWPIPTAVDSVTADGVFWGVVNVSDFFIEALVENVTYWVDNLSLKRRETTNSPAGYSTLTFLPAFNLWQNAGDTSDYRRCLLGDTDGRQSLEEIDFIRTPVSGGYNYTIRSITDLLTDINVDSAPADEGAKRNPGWSATAVGSFPSDGFHNNSRPAAWAWGGGALYANLTGQGQARWHYGFDRLCNATATIKAQALWDAINWAPGMGDIFGFTTGTTTGPIELRAVKFLRGQAHGVVHKLNNRVAKNVLVVVTETASGALAGYGITNGIGAYQTGLPYGRGNVSHDVSLDPKVTTLFYSRKRHRACGRIDPRCNLFMAWPLYFPFISQFGDREILAPEEWRHIPGEPGDDRWSADEWRAISGPSDQVHQETYFGIDERARAGGREPEEDQGEGGKTQG